VTIDERFTEDFRFRNIVKGLFHDVALNFLEVLNVFAIGQFVKINSMGFVTPKVSKIGGYIINKDGMCKKKTRNLSLVVNLKRFLETVTNIRGFDPNQR